MITADTPTAEPQLIQPAFKILIMKPNINLSSSYIKTAKNNYTSVLHVFESDIFPSKLKPDKSVKQLL